jgi:hypothetical protein
MIVVILSTHHPQADLFRRPSLPCRVPRTVPNASSQGKDAKGSKMVASRKFINLFDILGLIMVGPEGFEPPTKGL